MNSDPSPMMDAAVPPVVKTSYALGRTGFFLAAWPWLAFLSIMALKPG
jgi:hypothetical protein